MPFPTIELPFHAIGYCLKEAGILLKEVNHIANLRKQFLP